MRPTLGPDLRRAALRAAAVTALACGVTLVLPDWTRPSLVAAAVLAAEVAFAQALADLLAARRATRPRDAVLAAWVAGALVLPLATLQATYAEQVLSGVDPGQALDLVRRRLGEHALLGLLAGPFAALPLAFTGQLRREGLDGLGRVARTAGLLSLLTCAWAPFVFGLVMGTVLALYAAYAAADALDGALGADVPEDELAHLRRRIAAGELPRSRVWALAWVGHPAAARAVELATPPPVDLGGWVAGLDACREVYPVVALSLAEEVAPRLRAAERAVAGEAAAELAARLERALEVLRAGAARRPDAAAAARALLDGWREPAARAGEPLEVDARAAREALAWAGATKVVREALEVLARQDVPWARVVVGRQVQAAAELAATVTGDPQGVREAIRKAIVTWALDHDARPAPSPPLRASPTAIPEPDPDGSEGAQGPEREGGDPAR